MSEALIKEVEATVSPVYLVGGSVRDMLLEKEPKDYDFCSPLTPDEIEASVKKAGRRAYLTGKRFGTIGFKCQGRFIEVTTFRREQYIAGSRKPQVEYVTDLKEDLSRRDFTINAIAYKDGQYIDPYGGRFDLLARKIKAVGEAKDRIKDDPLRILRAARFSAQLGFEIDPNLVGKIRHLSHLIVDVSRERWVQELDKLLVSGSVDDGLIALVDMHVLRYVLPEVYIIARFYEKEWRLTLSDTQAAPVDADERWGRLLSYVGIVYAKEVKDGVAKYPYHELVARELVSGICARLKFSNDRTKRVLEIVSERKQIL